jgi:hypothetical protein
MEPMPATLSHGGRFVTAPAVAPETGGSHGDGRVRRSWPMRRVVWIAEDTEPTEDGEYLTGRFYGHVDDGDRIADAFEDLSLDEAVAWGRARADRVLIRIGHGRHVPVEEADLTPPPRRRIPSEEWKDRTEADPPIAWAVDVMLSPPDPRVRQDEVVAGIAEAAGGRWDAEPLEGRLAETDAQRGQEVYVLSHSASYRVRLRLEAPTHDQAVAAARARCDPPAGWRVAAFAEPAGDG